MHFFDCQNVEEAQTGSKPVLVEVGPYAYDEYFVKFDIKWTDGGDTVSFYTYRYYIFNQERTGPGLKETDTIRMPYPSVAGFQYILNKIPVSYQELVAEGIYNVLVLAQQRANREFQTLNDQIDANPDLRNYQKTAAHKIVTKVQGLSDRLFSVSLSSLPSSMYSAYYLLLIIGFVYFHKSIRSFRSSHEETDVWYTLWSFLIL